MSHVVAWVVAWSVAWAVSWEVGWLFSFFVALGFGRPVWVIGWVVGVIQVPPPRTQLRSSSLIHGQLGDVGEMNTV